jgi:trk system potassium uptake protein TrkA
MNTKKQFVIFGLGRFGRSVALTLDDLGFEVLGVDNDEAVVQSLADSLTHVVATDITDEKALRSLGVGNFDTAVIAVGDLGSSLMCAMLCKDLGVKQIVVKAIDEHHGKMAEKLGADKVVYSEQDMGFRVAHNLVSNNIVDYIELSDDISLVSVKVPASAVGKNLIEANFRHLYNVNVVAIRKGKETRINPDPKIALEADDEIFVIGEADAVKKFGELV